jgi:hypothetical protein
MTATVNTDGRVPPVRGPAADAEAEAGFYDALAWIAYAGMFLVTPFVVLLFRAHMHAAHYYLAGAMFIGCVIGFFMADAAATRIREGERSAGGPGDPVHHHA